MAFAANDLVVGPITLASGVTDISLDFFVEDETWLEVYKSGSDTPLVLGANYTFAGVGTSDGVVTLAVPADGVDAYSVYYVVPIERSSDLQLRGEFRSGTVNVELDRLWQAVQRVSTGLSRTLRVSKTSTAVAALFGEGAASRQDRTVVFDPTGAGLALGPTVTSLASDKQAAEAAAAAAAASQSAASTSASAASTSASSAAAARDATLEAAKFKFRTSAEMVADSTKVTYSTAAAGDVVDAGPYRFIVRPSGEAASHRTNAAGVKYHVLPNADGRYPMAAFGVTSNSRAAATANATAINLADAFAALKMSELSLPLGNVFFDSRIVKNTAWQGLGNGFWQTNPAANRPIAEQEIPNAPTQFIATGTFARDLYLPGVSSMQASGATKENLSPQGAGVNDGTYKWPSFMNDDGTLRAVSIAVWDKSKGGNNFGFRVVPDFGGDDGQDGYEDETEDGRSTADVDIGIAYENTQGVKYTDVSIVGHWRIAGRMINCVAFWDGVSLLPNEGVTPYNMTFQNCQFQGYVGSLELGSDSCKVVSVSGSTIKVAWADDLPLRNSAIWDFLKYNSDEGWPTTNIGVNVTSVVQDGDPTLALVTFASDVSGILTAGDTIVMRANGGGNSHIYDYNCRYHGFHFPNGAMCHDQNSVAAGEAFDAPGACIVYSGHRMTERVFVNAAVQTVEEVAFHFHDAARTEFINLEMERITAIVGVTGRQFRTIASPSSTDNTDATYPCGGTFQFKVDGNSSLRFPGIDWGQAIPVDRAGTFNGVGDVGHFNPNNLVFATYSGSNAWSAPYVTPFVDGKAGIGKPGHPTPTDAFVYDSSIDQLLGYSTLQIVKDTGSSINFTIEHDLAASDAILNMKTVNRGFTMRLDDSSAEMRFLWDGTGSGSLTEVGKYEGGATDTGFHFNQVFVGGGNRSGHFSTALIDLADDTTFTIPVPYAGGKLSFTVFNETDVHALLEYSGDVRFDVGASPRVSEITADNSGGQLETLATAVTDGTADGTDAFMIVSAVSGALKFKNRTGATRRIRYMVSV